MDLSKTESECSMTEIIPMREEKKDGDVNIMSCNPENVWDYLTLYTPRGTVLVRSRGHRKDQDIALVYEGLVFIASPGTFDAVIVVEWNSLVQHLNEHK